MPDRRPFQSEAQEGKDAEFSRGDDIYSHYLGDLEVAPNPCLAQLKKPPFHAVELVASDLGTVAGLRVNTDGQVLDANGQAIA